MDNISYCKYVKKLKKQTKEIKFEHDVKCSRVTISSKICNQDKFNELFDLIDNTKEYKNIISQHCFDKLTDIVTDYQLFLKQYKDFPNTQLNSWETQTIFQDIASHYSETAKRYLKKTKFITAKKTNLDKMACFINSQSNLMQKDYILSDLKVNDKYNLKTDSKQLVLDFHIQNKFKQLKVNLKKHNETLVEIKNSKQDKDTIDEITIIEKKIVSVNNLISYYKEIEKFSIEKPLLYQRIIELITTKKCRLLNHVHLGEYNTGTHARHLDNAQISIIKDSTNKEYQYFLKIRKSNKLDGREPKDKLELEEFNEKNFLYLPLIFNSKKLKQIGKTIDSILTKDNPQILIKSEQLRMNQSSRKIHIIFNYEQPNNLSKVINDSFLNKTNIDTTFENTIGADVNLKHNLLADSSGLFYDELLKNKSENKNKFINNVNEIVLLNSKPMLDWKLKMKINKEGVAGVPYSVIALIVFSFVMGVYLLLANMKYLEPVISTMIDHAITVKRIVQLSAGVIGLLIAISYLISCKLLLNRKQQALFVLFYTLSVHLGLYVFTVMMMIMKLPLSMINHPHAFLVIGMFLIPIVIYGLIVFLIKSKNVKNYFKVEEE